MTARPAGTPARLDWLDPLKALGLLAILVNHLVEEFGPGPWFTEPANNWPDLATRLHTWPGGPLPVALVRWLGWLGDSGPGVFILASGVGLTYAALHRPRAELMPRPFFRRRILRLFPLYIAMHLVILGASLGVPGVELNLAGWQTLLSLLGLRFTPQLFFSISPSWWFVWLILQLYVVFPLLFLLLERAGVRWFLAITIAFTIASRGFGILFSHSLFYWMMGQFFGTRLAEFAAGMAIAAILCRPRAEGAAPFGPGRALAAGGIVYVLGLGASFTLAGSLVSNLLVTLGFSGLFYAAWEGLLRKHAATARATVYVGAASYAVFLFHQAPLKWTAAVLGSHTELHLAAALAVLVLSFPISVQIERAVEWIQGAPRTLLPARLMRLGSRVVVAGAALALLLVERQLTLDGRMDRVFEMLVGLSITALIYVEWAAPPGERAGERLLRRGLIAAGFLQLFALPPRNGDLALTLGLLIAVLAAAASTRFRSPVRAGAAALFATGVVLAAAELALRRAAPLEVGGWGERPALEEHPTRIYGLIPNRTTRLRYNNYDYVVRTNSQGLQSPETAVARPTPDALRVLVIGDAFSMPEGLDYEQSYPALLQQALTRCIAPRRVQLINAGVTGYGPVEELPQLRELAAQYRPDLVLYQFFINEFDDVNATTERIRRQIGFGPRFPSWRVIVLDGSQIVAHLRQLFTSLAERLTGRPGPARYWKALLEYYRTGENPLYTQRNLEKVEWYLGAMKDAATAAGATLVVYFVPGAVTVSAPDRIDYYPWGQNLADSSRYDVQRPWRSLRTLAARVGIQAVDLTPYLRNHRPQPVYASASWHWNAEGHRAAADAILATLWQRDLLRAGCR